MGDSPIDSDVDPETGQIETGPLSPFGVPGAQIFTFDAGLVPDPTPKKDGVVGDRVWLDSNRNGLQDEGEVGVNGVTVKLFDQDGTFLTETVTASNESGEAGFYRFEGLESDRGSKQRNAILIFHNFHFKGSHSARTDGRHDSRCGQPKSENRESAP